MVALAVPAVLYLRGTVGPDTAVATMKAAGAAFAPYLGLILSYVFARGRTRAPRTPATGLAVAGALTMSVVWNAVVVAPLLLTLGGVTYLDDAASQMRDLSSYLAWLVAPALGYFFGDGNRNVADLDRAASA